MNNSLTNTQISFIIFCYILGYGIVALPRNTSVYLGTSAWIVIVLGSLVVMAAALLYLYLGKNFNNKTIYDYSEILVGKLITYIIFIIFCVNSIMSASMITRLSSENMKLTILINTPSWALSLLMLFVVFYTLINEINIIGRAFFIIGILILIPMFITPFIIFTKGNLVHLKPFFSLEIGALLNTLPTIIFPFVGIEILAFLPLDFNKRNKHITLYVASIILLIGIIYILIIESCISVMGTDSIVHYDDAVFATIRRIDFEFFQFLKRIDIIYVITRLFVIYTTLVLSLYIPIFLANKLFPSINRSYIVLSIIILTYVIGRIPKTMHTLRQILSYAGYLSVIVMIVIPLILSVVSLFRTTNSKK